MAKAPLVRPQTRNPRKIMPRSSRHGAPNTSRGLTTKQELFCQHRAAGFTGSQAYAKAGYALRGNQAWAEIHDLNNAPAIKARLAQLLDGYAKEHGITVASLVNELERARERAITTLNAGAEVAAIMNKAKLLGFLVERVEITQRKPVGQPTTKTEITEAEWLKLVEAPKLLPAPTNGSGNGQAH